jgi:hypothetical protein
MASVCRTDRHQEILVDGLALVDGDLLEMEAT